MTTTTYYNRFMISAVLAAVLSGNAFADVLFSNPNAYFNMAGSASWTLTGNYEGATNGPTPTHFEFQNVNSKETAQVTLYSYLGTTSYIGYGDHKILYDSDSAGWFDIHTPYNWGVLLPSVAAIDSLYIKAGALVDPSNYIPSGTAYATHATMVAIDSLGNEWKTHQLLSDEMFFGLILEEGYLTEVYWYLSDGADETLLSFTPDLNVPYLWDYYGSWQYVEFGFGDGTIGESTAVPEPAALLIAGMGIAGLAAARRFRKR